MFTDLVQTLKIPEIADIRDSISNWLLISDLIYSTTDLHRIKCILYVEYKKFNRPYSIQRIYQRYNKLRRQQERNDMKAFVKSARADYTLNYVLHNQIKFRNFIKDNKPTEEVFKALLKTELAYKNRPYMVKLIYGALNAQRSKLEMNQLGLTK
jgi:hypothetical protein